VDAAYGGYFKVISSENANLSAFNLISQCDSLTFDPHKQGLQPYGCGCVIFRDSSVGKFYKHDSPYTYFTSKELHLGEISVECSRAGAAAAALWFTHQLFPLKSKEGFGPILQKTLDAAMLFSRKLRESKKFELYIEPETNIVTYFPIAPNTQEISRRSEEIMQKLMNENKLWIATLKVESDKFAQNHPEIEVNSSTVLILRSCIMKPEQYDWIDEIMKILEN
jgi:glutamate/tyrosine decarboxylase-like PLP-dependent enzyme